MLEGGKRLEIPMSIEVLRAAQRRAVRILVDISMEYYEQMVNRVAEHSRVHFILMNGVVVHDYQTGVRRRVVKILCNKSDAEMLRDATGTLCPEALPEMEQSIKLSHEI